MKLNGFTYIIGDIHGCAETFRYMVETKLNLTKNDELYLLGDYINRGPDSKGVIDFILHLIEEGFQVFPLRGNHEEMLLNSSRKNDFFEIWLNDAVGLKKEDKEKFSVKYLQFFKQLPLFIHLKERGLLLVHAGVDFNKKNPLQNADTILWTRVSKFNDTFPKNTILVHGHTPVPLDNVEKNLKENPLVEINLDGGCVYKNRKGQGNLIALNFEKMELIVVPNRGETV
ncbi:MAG: hypothetical protein A2275_08950 [Bacteroidetes bacterium RIFOXYA12_FULL_35_11]|nr:MAG: hypothetical protein A2X01_06075 [Bacteroidetes bacterium GWF2_35_48]OFY82928.1 MAG: hypothetical protein A2275_08950 [Bacteroidetes bacterium RIFOXYA12_FULL_35_11]OFY95278.1 MAG: hypothetical protein A2309_03140 [Bacteroidetes bacterium RIFOXYB2_FULL_35_7]OFZ01882.1 MAG: hypothetical protein A2491_02410 [Bacteroidetes bacterium RIFOXYC12_FULL_35_7]HBX52760.1 serine/threonine protein phosphatase [Bacteroidales bacterium]